jgi:hypothetical protein
LMVFMLITVVRKEWRREIVFFSSSELVYEGRVLSVDSTHKLQYHPSAATLSLIPLFPLISANARAGVPLTQSSLLHPSST